METRQFLSKKIQKSFILILLLQLLCISCEKEYEYNTACVYRTQLVHRGSGYYRLKIYYSFEYHDSLYIGSVRTPGTYRIYGRKHFKEGDSVFIKYPTGKPEKSELANFKVKRKNQCQIRTINQFGEDVL